MTNGIKKLMAGALATFLSVGMANAYAPGSQVKFQKLKSNGLIFRLIDGETAACEGQYIHNDPDMQIILIPEIVSFGSKTYTVTAIGDNAFEYCTNIKEVIMPQTVTHIGEEAFYICTGLTSINIPEGVTYIGPGAFDSVGLTSVVIPESVTSIEPYTFSWSKITSVTIPESVTSIGRCAFSYCRNLTSIDIPDTVTSIGSAAFISCHALESVKLPKNITSIKGSTFDLCKSLTEITIPEGVTSIGSEAFSWCESLKTVNLPASVTHIEEGAFESCPLLSITLPENLSYIVGNAFWNCPLLSSVYCLSRNVPELEPYHSSKHDGFGSGQDIDLYVYEGVLEEYKNSAWAQYFTRILPIPEAGAGTVGAQPGGGLLRVYDIAGRLVLSTHDRAALQGLAKGTYIVNGKKVAL